MAIDGINPLGGVRQPDDQKVEEETKARDDFRSERAGSGDSVDFAAGDVAKFASQFDKIPDVRSDKIDALQQEIADGSYRVPSEDLAAIIIDELT